MDYDDLLELVKNRRSIRRYRPDPVPEEYIDKIIEVARWAPSGFNQQPWEFVVIREPEVKNKIVQFCRESMVFEPRMDALRESWQGKARFKPSEGGSDFSAAPVFILLLGDIRTKEGLPMGLRCEPYLLQTVFISGLANAFLYMHLAATSLGLGSQWVSAVHRPYPQCMIKDLLKIRKEMEIYDMMALGYSAMNPAPKLLKDKEKTVHFDICDTDDFRTDKEVREFIRKSRTWNIAAENMKASNLKKDGRGR